MRSGILSRAWNQLRNASSIAARWMRTLTLRQAQGRLFDPLPYRERGRLKKRDSSPFGYAQGFGWWKRGYPDAL
jgi:hypothetical protein